MRKEWEKGGGPAIKDIFKKSTSKLSELKNRLKGFAAKSKTIASKTEKPAEEEWPEEWTDTGSVD